MLVKTENSIYIIEFKCNQGSCKAIEQIMEKNYPERFRMVDKEIILIKINFDTERRNIGDYDIVKI